ncbi:hypothetical protein GCM10011391_28160 [Pullulanibacillus camelliae]|uniref:Uncharacterized protein n=2 Tax=Pullulanibacillus camelliae TaxID=1707096 RepID=A0A8J3DX29_9BACL|nr:hypothetical protein GCM10011391_28160 [Pullulanibacillus camelliae]
MGSLQFIFVIGIAILVILLGGEHHIITHSNTEDIHWAIWSSLILISGPIVDQQIWQRRISTGYSISPFILSSLIFAFYMCLIGLLAYFGKMHSILIGIIVIGVAGSTLVGALSAVGSYGKTIFQSRTWMVILFLMALMALVAKTNILNLWTFYGSIRVPFAIIAAFCIIIKTLKNN